MGTVHLHANARAMNLKQIIEAHKDIIEEIKNSTVCDFNFQCVEKCDCDICKVSDFGISNFLKCEDKRGPGCRASLSFGSYYFCRCKMRKFIFSMTCV